MAQIETDENATNKKALIGLRRSLFFISAPMVFISFALPLRAEDLGASAVQIGILYSLFTISIFIVRPLTGVGLDAMGRRPFFLAAAAFYFFANLLYAVNENIEGLYIARVLQGLGFAILAITTEAITSDIANSKSRAAAMGSNIASQTRGGMAGGTIGFTLVGIMPLYAWVYSFWIFTAVSILAIVIAAMSIPETRPAHGDARVTTAFSMPPNYLRILVIIFAAAFAGALIQPYYLIYLRSRFDVELYMLAAAFLPIGIAYAVLPGFIGRVSDKIHRASAIALGVLLAGVFYAAVPQVAGFFWVIGAFLAAAIGSVLIDLTKNAWVADISGAGAIGRTFGLAALASGAGAAAGPLVGGYIYDSLGPDYLFYTAGLILFGVALIAVALRPREKAI
jgi:predicted MFS family arabinose efflux permease